MGKRSIQLGRFYASRVVVEADPLFIIKPEKIERTDGKKSPFMISGKVFRPSRQRVFKEPPYQVLMEDIIRKPVSKETIRSIKESAIQLLVGTKKIKTREALEEFFS